MFLNKKDILSIPSYQILDVRNIHSFKQQRIKRSLHIDVNKLNDAKSIKSSLLLTKNALQDALRLQGVNSFKNYLVLGLGIHKWGEDGRLYWLLSNSSSANVYLYDGGFKQYSKDFPDKLTKGTINIKSGNIILDKDWQPLSYAEVKNYQGTVVDVRTTAEFLGATPFGSQTGGRLPNAISFPWSDFFTPRGLIDHSNKSAVLDKMAKDQKVLVYCTAGYRSALVYAVLKDWGFKADNYDGSWFEYSIRSQQ